MLKERKYYFYFENVIMPIGVCVYIYIVNTYVCFIKIYIKHRYLYTYLYTYIHTDIYIHRENTAILNKKMK